MLTEARNEYTSVAFGPLLAESRRYSIRRGEDSESSVLIRETIPTPFGHKDLF